MVVPVYIYIPKYHLSVADDVFGVCVSSNLKFKTTNVVIATKGPKMSFLKEDEGFLKL